MRCGNVRERTIGQFVIIKNKLMSIFNASVLLLTVIILLLFCTVIDCYYSALCNAHLKTVWLTPAR